MKMKDIFNISVNMISMKINLSNPELLLFYIDY